MMRPFCASRRKWALLGGLMCGTCLQIGCIQSVLAIIGATFF